jgi:hypothetical protein
VNRKRKIIVAAIGAAALVAGGGAVAASQSTSPSERSRSLVADAAKQLGVDPAKLSGALEQAYENQVDADVAAGRITKEQGDVLKQAIESGDYPLLGVHGPRLGFGHGAHGILGGLDAAASYLGLTDAELRSALAGGKSLADVAKERGKSVDGLVDALTDAATAKLDAAVDAGSLTQARADELKADLKQHLTDLVNGVRPAFSGPPGGGEGFRVRIAPPAGTTA